MYAKNFLSIDMNNLSWRLLCNGQYWIMHDHYNMPYKYCSHVRCEFVKIILLFKSLQTFLIIIMPCSFPYPCILILCNNSFAISKIQLNSSITLIFALMRNSLLNSIKKINLHVPFPHHSIHNTLHFTYPFAPLMVPFPNPLPLKTKHYLYPPFLQYILSKSSKAKKALSEIVATSWTNLCFVNLPVMKMIA